MVEGHVDYREPNEDQRSQQMAIAAEAFGIDPAREAAHYDLLGDDGRLRVVVRNGHVAAGLVAIHAGQWLGGKALPAWPIAGVAVAPHERGNGVGFALMREMIREAHRERVALLPLYAATTTFYRKLGFEFGGDWCAWELPREQLAGLRTGATFEPFNPRADDPPLELYERRAARSAGVLARNRFFWRKAVQPPDEPVHGYLVSFDGQPEGYVVFDHRRTDHAVFVRDAVTLTSRAALATLELGGRTNARALRWWGGPADGMAWGLNEVRAQAPQRQEPWMVRVANVEAALAGRGYPAIDATLEFEIRDDLVPENAGLWRLVLRDGEPAVERGGAGALRLDIRGFSALFTGHRTVEELRTLGLAEGEAAAASIAAAVFAGPRPWMADRF